MPLILTEPPGGAFLVTAPMMILMFGGLRIRESRTITGGRRPPPARCSLLLHREKKKFAWLMLHLDSPRHRLLSKKGKRN